MLISPYSRYFMRYEIKFRPYRDNGVALDFYSKVNLDVVDVLTAAIENGTATLTLQNNDVVKLTSLDVKEKDGIAILLFRRSDPDASDPVFEHRKTNKLRPSDKKDDEAEAVSAHLFVSITGTATPHPTYRAILEEVPGLGRTYIQSIVREVLREEKYEYEDRRGDAHETYTLAEFGGVPSETVGNALKGGKGAGIQFIELVREPRLDGLDTGGLVPHEERMKISIRATDQNNLSLVRRVKEWAGVHNWSKVRVQVQSGGRTKVVDIAHSADAADVLFVKSMFITVKKKLAQCTDVISAELAGMAKKMLDNDDGWG